MKILIVNDNPLEKIGEDFYSIYSWIKFPLFLSHHFDRTTLWAPVQNVMRGGSFSTDAWRLDRGHWLRIEPNHPYDSFATYYRLLPRCYMSWRRRALQLIGAHDLVVIACRPRCWKSFERSTPTGEASRRDRRRGPREAVLPRRGFEGTLAGRVFHPGEVLRPPGEAGRTRGRRDLRIQPGAGPASRRGTRHRSPERRLHF